MSAPTWTSDGARWQAVAERDAAARGAFVYAVASTGIYCRPGCPSRTPRQDNVRYFPDHHAAEAAGFRPCARCHPRQARGCRLPAAGWSGPWPRKNPCPLWPSWPARPP